MHAYRGQYIEAFWLWHWQLGCTAIDCQSLPSNSKGCQSLKRDLQNLWRCVLAHGLVCLSRLVYAPLPVPSVSNADRFVQFMDMRTEWRWHKTIRYAWSCSLFRVRVMCTRHRLCEGMDVRAWRTHLHICATFYMRQFLSITSYK